MDSKRSRFFALVVAAAVPWALAGCGSRNDYPKDWPAVETSWFRSCPDLAGTYALGREAPPIMHVLFEARPPWERLIIDGRPGGELRFTLTRTVTPDPVSWSPPHDAREQAEAGLRARAQSRTARAVPAVPTETTQVLPRSGYSCSRGRLMVHGGYLLARDRSRGLVGRGERAKVTKQIDVWCGDGCKGIPLGFESQGLWQRWELLGVASLPPRASSASS
jgi:hypothetical protein